MSHVSWSSPKQRLLPLIYTTPYQPIFHIYDAITAHLLYTSYIYTHVNDRHVSWNGPKLQLLPVIYKTPYQNIFYIYDAITAHLIHTSYRCTSCIYTYINVWRVGWNRLKQRLLPHLRPSPLLPVFIHISLAILALSANPFANTQEYVRGIHVCGCSHT